MGFWGWTFMATIGWGVWSAIPQDSCVRVHRVAAPVRAAGTLIKLAVKNWVDPQTNNDLERQINSLSMSTEEFAAQELYGNSLKCRWGSGESDIGFSPQDITQSTEQSAKNAADQAKSLGESMNHVK